MAMRAEAQFFRANVGAMILNDGGEILAFERIDRAGFWQMPQGGLDVGEEPAAAALREVEEETGLRADDLRLLDEHPTWLAYELPLERRRKHLGRGQVQKWFCYRLVGAEARIRPEAADHPEFRAWRWMGMEELMRTTTSFRVPVYRQLAARFATWLGCVMLCAVFVGLAACDRQPSNAGTGGGITTDGKSVAVDRPALAPDGTVTWAEVRVTTRDRERLKRFWMVAFYDLDNDARKGEGEVGVGGGASFPPERRALHHTFPACPGGVLRAPVPRPSSLTARYEYGFEFEDGGTYTLSGTFAATEK